MAEENTQNIYPKHLIFFVAIMRAFVMIREYALTYKDLTDRLKEIEGKFTDVYDALNYLLNKDKVNEEQRTRKRIGFIIDNE
jgi:hypothetical protein